jgi:hypothetical protein
MKVWKEVLGKYTQVDIWHVSWPGVVYRTYTNPFGNNAHYAIRTDYSSPSFEGLWFQKHGVIGPYELRPLHEIDRGPFIEFYLADHGQAK